MKAIVYRNYGPPDVVKYEEVEKPIAGDHEVLIKVFACSLNALDSHLRSADIFLVRTGGLLKPKDQRIGVDLAGRVEAVGRAVTQFKAGDEVFGTGVGALAEYAVAKEDSVVLKPNSVSFEAAATVPVAGLTALQALRDHGKLQPNQRVLIQGASGGVGTYAVQIAKALGAQVTATCRTRNLDMVRSIGADHVIDYTKEDFTRSNQQYDLILGVNGYHPIWAYRRALSQRGIFILIGASSARLLRAMLQAFILGPVFSRTGGQKLGFMGIAKMNQKDLTYLGQLLETRQVVPVIDKRYPLGETAEAFRYFEEEHARGKVVVTMEGSKL